MPYLVLELQSSGPTITHLATSYTDEREARSKFHQILAAAELSQVPTHTAMVVDEDGFVLAHEVCKHAQE